jgi:large subunit ribosomal protein L9
MEVILFDNVKNLGRQGDIVRVAEGYFRNFLKPNGLADEATPVNRKRFETMKKKHLELQAQKSAEARELAGKLEGVVVKIKSKAGDSDKLFGSVTQQDIAEALSANGFTVDKKQIEIHEPIKKLGEHTISIRIHPEVEGKLKILVEKI